MTFLFGKLVAGGLLLSAQSAVAQQWWQVQNMPGGNGLCADPASMGPNAPVGGYVPVNSRAGKYHSLSVAKRGTSLYLDEPTMQTPEDANIISTCQPDSRDVLKTVVVTAACQQVVAGMNYKVESTMTIPCSDEDVAKLPAGTDLTRTIWTNAYKPLPVDGKSQSPEVEDVQGVTDDTPPMEDDFCPYVDQDLEGGFSTIEDPSQDDQVVTSAKLAASAYFENPSQEFQDAVAICYASEDDFVNSVQVSRACSQVVAGTNYMIQFTGTIPCSEENAANLPEGFLLKQGFQAEVFVPLPVSNEAPQVTSVKNTGGLIGF